MSSIEEPGKWAVVEVTYGKDKNPPGRGVGVKEWFIRTDARSDRGCNWSNGSLWAHSWDEVLGYGDVEVMSPGPEQVWDDCVEASRVCECALGAHVEHGPNPYRAEVQP